MAKGACGLLPLHLDSGSLRLSASPHPAQVRHDESVVTGGRPQQDSRVWNASFGRGRYDDRPLLAAITQGKGEMASKMHAATCCGVVVVLFHSCATLAHVGQTVSLQINLLCLEQLD